MNRVFVHLKNHYEKNGDILSAQALIEQVPGVRAGELAGGVR